MGCDCASAFATLHNSAFTVVYPLYPCCEDPWLPCLCVSKFQVMDWFEYLHQFSHRESLPLVVYIHSSSLNSSSSGNYSRNTRSDLIREKIELTMKRKKKKKKYTVSFTLPCWHGCLLLYTFSLSRSTFEYSVVTIPYRPCMTFSTLFHPSCILWFGITSASVLLVSLLCDLLLCPSPLTTL